MAARGAAGDDAAEVGSRAGRAPGRPSRTGRRSGRAWMRTPLLDNLELAELDVHVVPAHRRGGTGSALLAVLEDEARSRGRRVLTGLSSWSYDAGTDRRRSAGPEFARARGYDLALSEVQRELRLPVDGDVLGGLADDAVRCAPGVHAARRGAGPCPTTCCRAGPGSPRSSTTEAPTGDLELEPEAASTDAVREREDTAARQGRTKYDAVALSSTGELVAYSDLATTVHEPGRAYQWGTLVRREPAATGSASRSRSPTCSCCSVSARHHPADDLQRRGQQPHDRRQRGAGLPSGRSAGGLPEAARPALSADPHALGGGRVCPTSTGWAGAHAGLPPPRRRPCRAPPPAARARHARRHEVRRRGGGRCSGTGRPRRRPAGAGGGGPPAPDGPAPGQRPPRRGGRGRAARPARTPDGHAARRPAADRRAGLRGPRRGLRPDRARQPRVGDQLVARARPRRPVERVRRPRDRHPAAGARPGGPRRPARSARPRGGGSRRDGAGGRRLRVRLSRQGPPAGGARGGRAASRRDDGVRARPR